MGEVWPCVFTRWMPSGSVLERHLAEILDGGLQEHRSWLAAWFEGDEETAACSPRCGPTCNPISCGPRCNPIVPACGPKGMLAGGPVLLAELPRS
ncbi:MAG: hypothetical protein ACRDT0_04600 [Pseudonocardiaceae bacterium]